MRSICRVSWASRGSRTAWGVRYWERHSNLAAFYSLPGFYESEELDLEKCSPGRCHRSLSSIIANEPWALLTLSPSSFSYPSKLPFLHGYRCPISSHDILPKEGASCDWRDGSSVKSIRRSCRRSSLVLNTPNMSGLSKTTSMCTYMHTLPTFIDMHM